MTPVSDKAFAVMAVCPEAKKYYGITVESSSILNIQDVHIAKASNSFFAPVAL